MGDNRARWIARHAWLIALLALVLAVAAACGDDDDGDSSSAAAEATSAATSAAAEASSAVESVASEAESVASEAESAVSSAEGETSAAATGEATGEPLLIGGPFAQTGPAGIADHKDCWNGTQMAIDEINSAGGVNGRPLKLEVVDIDMLTPEGTQSAFQALVDKNVDAIVSPFSITWQPGIDVTAAAEIPYLSGGTSSPAIAYAKTDPEKFFNFVSDPAELNYGVGFIQSLDLLVDSGKWTPKNNKVDIVVGDSEYNTLIADGTKQAIADSGGKWELGEVSDVQGGITDWSPILQKLQQSDAGVIMIDHWIGAELAAFAQQFSANPVPGSLVYLQYGPSQPEFLDIAGESAEGFYWGTMIGVPDTGKGAEFRQKYTELYPGTFGLVYTGWCYDMVQILKDAWTNVDPADTHAVMDWIKSHPYDGTTGHIDFSNVETPVYPENAATPEEGVTHLFFQVQGGEHKIVLPEVYKQTDYVTPPWG
jgi:branched-chain amino acid transport system substrate-binding protein